MGFLAATLKKEKPKSVVYESEETVEVSLVKHRGPFGIGGAACTGLNWQDDPTYTKLLQNNDNWPRDGAKLRGRVVTVDGVQWLLATEVLNKGQHWKKAPEGAAIPFQFRNRYSLELS